MSQIPHQQHGHFTKLSVIVPIFNEVRTLDSLLVRLKESLPADTQVILIDDASCDGSDEILKAWQDNMKQWCCLRHEKNQGKGSAVRTGLEHATGLITIIQDADLEYEPKEIRKVIAPIQSAKAQVCFGSRYLHFERRNRRFVSPSFRSGVWILNQISRILFGQKLTDQATCYKAMPTELWRKLELKSIRFELCAEITAKLGRLHIPILEIPISYQPRSIHEGKKISWRDGLVAIAMMLQIYWSKEPFAQKVSSNFRAIS